jgi:hypothetical protein
MSLSASAAIDLVTRLVSMYVMVTSLEFLVQRRVLQDSGLLGWPVCQVRHPAFVRSWFASPLDLFFRYRVTMTIIGVRLGCAAVLFAAPAIPARQILLPFVAVTALLLGGRSPFGMDGADQMGSLTLAALALQALVPTPLVSAAVLWFLTLQLVMSYVVAGTAKLLGPMWRDGSAIWGIASTRMYGVPRMGLWLKGHERISMIFAWGVIAGEAGFGAAFFLPRPFALPFVIGGSMFHFLAAALMGLNTFFWSFMATYPALLYCLLTVNPAGAGLP